MNPRVWGMAIILGAAGVAVAAQGSPYAEALQQVVDSFEKIGASLKTIVDEETAGAAKPQLRKAATSFLEARAKAAKMQPPEKEEKRRLEKEFKPKLEAAMKKMFGQVRRVEGIPGGKDALKELDAVLKKSGK